MGYILTKVDDDTLYNLKVLKSVCGAKSWAHFLKMISDYLGRDFNEFRKDIKEWKEHEIKKLR